MFDKVLNTPLVAITFFEVQLNTSHFYNEI